MKLHYYSETDSSYIKLTERGSVDSQEVSPGVVLDYDSDGALVRIDINNACAIIDVSSTDNMPNGDISSAPGSGVSNLASKLLKLFFKRPTLRQSGLTFPWTDLI